MRVKLYMLLWFMFFVVPLIFLPKIFPDNQIVQWVSLIFTILVFILLIVNYIGMEKEEKGREKRNRLC
ncbi:hypothetical protein [Bacillus sp. C30]|uniref:hypothetical protein n=1 Tax=Bacillus sp. C30 TaxID=1387733 RepID=UPI00349F7275